MTYEREVTVERRASHTVWFRISKEVVRSQYTSQLSLRAIIPALKVGDSQFWEVRELSLRDGRQAEWAAPQPVETRKSADDIYPYDPPAYKAPAPPRSPLPRDSEGLRTGRTTNGDVVIAVPTSERRRAAEARKNKKTERRHHAQKTITQESGRRRRKKREGHPPDLHNFSAPASGVGYCTQRRGSLRRCHAAGLCTCESARGMFGEWRKMGEHVLVPNEDAGAVGRQRSAQATTEIAYAALRWARANDAVEATTHCLKKLDIPVIPVPMGYRVPRNDSESVELKYAVDADEQRNSFRSSREPGDLTRENEHDWIEVPFPVGATAQKNYSDKDEPRAALNGRSTDEFARTNQQDRGMISKEVARSQYTSQLSLRVVIPAHKVGDSQFWEETITQKSGGRFEGGGDGDGTGQPEVRDIAPHGAEACIERRRCHAAGLCPRESARGMFGEWRKLGERVLVPPDEDAGAVGRQKCAGHERDRVCRGCVGRERMTRWRRLLRRGKRAAEGIRGCSLRATGDGRSAVCSGSRGVRRAAVYVSRILPEPWDPVVVKDEDGIAKRNGSLQTAEGGRRGACLWGGKCPARSVHEEAEQITGAKHCREWSGEQGPCNATSCGGFEIAAGNIYQREDKRIKRAAAEPQAVRSCGRADKEAVVLGSAMPPRRTESRIDVKRRTQKKTL
ncbi:hypothetical protein C8R44DRAFT_861513 [Mycena epipterygia]|nr:hypothetical protein C8R44DRAFT_861513 [Mycena epipterygia]